jgi:hypothetical protein
MSEGLERSIRALPVPGSTVGGLNYLHEFNGISHGLLARDQLLQKKFRAVLLRNPSIRVRIILPFEDPTTRRPNSSYS